MNQLILHRYFKGIASRKEEELILEWVEASEENTKTFRKERMLYDISLFSNEKQQTNTTKKNRMLYIAKWSFRIAASVLVLLSCALLFNEYNYSRSSQLQIVAVPAGQRAEVVLADGTKVWLNSRSTLTYAADFGRKNRSVELDGEAYFEVVKNSGIPFFVNTEHNKIKVVGTSFNVSAYKGSDEFETALVEGIVDIYNRKDDRMIAKLTKDQFFVAEGNNYRKISLHSHEFLRWKEGLYCFDDTPFKNLLDKLEKYYNVNITVENPAILDYQCTGKFKENDGVEHILKVIRKDHLFSYTITENKDSIVIR
jgi:ferric-dicitrate binding protein FerR (iron transport regulator)